MMLTLLLNLISKVPFAALYIVADGFYLLNRYVIRYRYDVVRGNLRNAFPDMSDTELNALTEQIFRNLADLLVEIIKGITISREELERRMEIKPSERVVELVEQGTPLIFLSAHHCNWEWLLLYSSLHLPHPLMVAYQPFSNERFDEFMLKARTRFGCQTVPASDLIRQVIRLRKTMKTLALLADQTPARDERKYWTTFLNQDTAFLDGTDSLAWLTGMPVVFVNTKRVTRGHYEVRLDVIAEPPYEKNSQVIVERYARELEAMILSDPSVWLWSHRRWKFGKPVETGDSR
jgi:KDO2-lipid IV(A) lauroyltransferase